MRLHKFKLYVKVTVRRLSNPVFFMLLALSLCLWYITKLSYVYTTDIQIPVRIDSTLYSVRCNVEGVGYQILKHKIGATAWISRRTMWPSRRRRVRPVFTTSRLSRFRTSSPPTYPT